MAFLRCRDSRIFTKNNVFKIGVPPPPPVWANFSYDFPCKLFNMDEIYQDREQRGTRIEVRRFLYLIEDGWILILSTLSKPIQSKVKSYWETTCISIRQSTAAVCQIHVFWCYHFETCRLCSHKITLKFYNIKKGTITSSWFQVEKMIWFDFTFFTLEKKSVLITPVESPGQRITLLADR